MYFQALSLVLLLVASLEAADYLRPCYFTNWAQYREGEGKYEPEMYVPGLCTHILYAFGKVNGDFTVSASDPTDLADWNGNAERGNYARINALKQRQTGLKTLLSFGGWTAGTATFKQLAASAQGRQVFVSSVLQFIDKYNFDGVDIDWEYPEASDRDNYVVLMRELKQAAGQRLVTVAVSAAPEKIDAGYDAAQLANILDFVNVMTYDFHGGWEQQTGENSPLFAGPGDSPQWNSAYAMQYWADKGMPKSKLLLGIGTYGRGWTLSDPANNGMNAPGTTMPAMPFTKEAGIGSYYEICSLGGAVHWDDQQKVPYMVKGSLWIGYDDVHSVQVKMQWVKDNGFAGAFVWTLGLDDFGGKCGDKYPLISEIGKQLGGGGGPVIEPTGGPNPPTQPPVTQSPVGPFTCPSDGLFADPTNCSRFYSCAHGTAYLMYCPTGLLWNDSAKVCDWPSNVKCSH